MLTSVSDDGELNGSVPYFVVLILYSTNPIAAITIAITIAIIMIVTVSVDVSWKLRSTCRNAVSPTES